MPLTLKKFAKCLIMGSFFLTVLQVSAFADTIEKIVISGNKKVSKDTVLFYMNSAEKGLFSEQILRKDFQTLWKTGFFENITIEAQNGGEGKIVTLVLTENPVLKSVTFNTGKKIKEKDIRDKLQEYNISLLAFSYYNPSMVKRSKKIILDMMKEKGYNTASVTIDSQVEMDQVNLVLQVKPGPRTRIGKIEFPGLQKTGVSPFFLREGMKHNKAHNLLSRVGGKDVFNKKNMTEDLEAVKFRLQQKGYLEARVGTPTFSFFERRSVTGKSQQMLKISIPVEPGPRYKVGTIKIEGNKLAKMEFLETLVTLKQGEVFNVKKRDKSREAIEELYRSLSHIYCQVTPMENLDPVKQTADITFNIHEGEKAYVGKLTFKGNEFTRDKVIRREWLLREGLPLNMNALKTSITRMRQLGLVDIEKTPEFHPDPKNPHKVDIDVEVKEMSRQSVNFNAGYSGYDGLFLSLGYSTRNFLGAGETMAVNFQTGTRSKNYSFSYTEPYLFNLPANLGFSVSKTSLDYSYLSKKSTGFGISTSARLWGYWNAALSYNYEDVESSATSLDGSEIDSYLALLYNYSGTISALTPTIYYSSVDSPLFPTRGTKILFSYKYAGGFLGGDVNLHKTKFQLVKFIPVWKRHVLGFQLVHQALIPMGDGEIPFWEKFLLGEQGIRGFDPYKITPRDENGNALGGNKAAYFNVQYEIPLNRQFSAILFYDVGNAYNFGQPISLKNVYSSAGLELKIFIPMLNVPFRLIFAYNPRILEPEDSHFQFRFTVGTSFN